MKHRLIVTLVTLIIAAAGAHAQDDPSFDDATDDLQKQLQESVAELAALREQIAAETIPLSEELSRLERELSDVRSEYQSTTRTLDTGLLDLSNIQRQIDNRKDESGYLANLLTEYIRNFDSRLHIAEIQRYDDLLDAARLAGENDTISEQDLFATQIQVVSASLDRLHEALGGKRYDGTAVDESGLVRNGAFIVIGPTAYFSADDSEVVGTVEQRLGSLEPAIIAFDNPLDTDAARQTLAGSGTTLPIDTTLGNAHVIATTKDTIWEHIQKGGVVMIPIFILAGFAFLVALLKWIGLLFVRNPSQRKLRVLLTAVAKRDKAESERAAAAIAGPAGRMLEAGVEHIEEPRDLIEEVMYERVLSTKLRVQRFLPFIAISAAAAPLLGLLGTVTGIINTFKLITVFGTGDVKTLSGGISEALITTEFGLIVAIPSLLLHALLSRKARGVIDRMEKAAVAFANQVGKTPFRTDPSHVATPTMIETTPTATASAAPTTEQVRNVLAELLSPVVQNGAGEQTNRNDDSNGESRPDNAADNVEAEVVVAGAAGTTPVASGDSTT